MPGGAKKMPLVVRAAGLQPHKDWVKKSLQNLDARSPVGAFANVALPQQARKPTFSFQPVTDHRKALSAVLVNHKASVRPPGVKDAGVGTCVPEPSRRVKAITGPVKPLKKKFVAPTKTSRPKPSSVPTNSSSTACTSPAAKSSSKRSNSHVPKAKSRHDSEFDDSFVDLLDSPLSQSKPFESSPRDNRAIPTPSSRTSEEPSCYGDLKVHELRRECRERSLSDKGSKSTLAQRLATDDAGGSVPRQRQTASRRSAHHTLDSSQEESDFEGVDLSDFDDDFGPSQSSTSRKGGGGSAARGVVKNRTSSANSGSAGGSSRDTVNSTGSAPNVAALETKLERLTATIRQLLARKKNVPKKIVSTIAELKVQIAAEKAAAEARRQRPAVDIAALTAKLKAAKYALKTADDDLLTNLCMETLDRREKALAVVTDLQQQLDAATNTDCSPVASTSSGMARPFTSTTTNPPSVDQKKKSHRLDSSDDDDEFGDLSLDLDPDDESPDFDQGSGSHSAVPAPSYSSYQANSSYGSSRSEPSYNDQSYNDHYGGGSDRFSRSSIREGSRSRSAGGDGGDGGNYNFYESSQKLHEQARAKFGHRRFRECQEDVIRTALQGKDCFVLMPTGGGKSLCYQLPASLFPGVTFVVSPLLSLIQDQVEALNDNGINAAGLTSNIEAHEQSAILRDLFTITPTVKVVYVTPEKIKASEALNNAFDKLYSNGKLNLFVIDEAHCVSQWGHDFRPDYLNLKVLKQTYPNTPLMALTATADKRVVTHIKQNLGMPADCATFSRSFNRENLIYNVEKKESKAKTLDKIAAFVKSHGNEAGIIYCTSRKDTEMVTEELKKRFRGTSLARHVNFYHAGLEDPELRRQRHLDWQHDRCRLIVATVAFGMGIDKPDVRYVIHYSLPKSLVHYYQESGRAGRDGQRSICTLYYSFNDKRKVDWLIEQSDNKDSQHRQKTALNQMVLFCEDNVHCRRFKLLRHFGETFDSKKCHGTCDNCRSKCRVRQQDCTKEARAIVQALSQVDASDNFTMAHFISVFRGSSAKKIKDKRHDRLRMYGMGKSLSTSLCHRLFHELIVNEYLTEEDVKNKFNGYSNTYLRAGPKARRLLSDNEKFVLAVRGEKRKLEVAPTRAAPREVGGFQLRVPAQTFHDLFEHLKTFRAGLANKMGKSSFLLLTTAALQNIAVRLPKTDAELGEIDGISNRKLDVAKQLMNEAWHWLANHSGGVKPKGTFQHERKESPSASNLQSFHFSDSAAAKSGASGSAKIRKRPSKSSSKSGTRVKRKASSRDEVSSVRSKKTRRSNNVSDLSDDESWMTEGF